MFGWDHFSISLDSQLCRSLWDHFRISLYNQLCRSVWCTVNCACLCGTISVYPCTVNCACLCGTISVYPCTVNCACSQPTEGSRLSLILDFNTVYFSSNHKNIKTLLLSAPAMFSSQAKAKQWSDRWVDCE